MKNKNNSFIQILVAICILLCNIFGILYVIPLYSIIGEEGGILFSYAYNIYLIVISLSQIGIPYTINKVISEYYTLGYNKTKERAFRIAKRLMFFISIIIFLLLFLFAKDISYLIIGNIKGGTKIQDIAFVIRLSSFSILLYPLLNIYKGYLQGHKKINDISIEGTIQEAIKLIIIIFGSLLALKVFKKPLRSAVGIITISTSITAVFIYVYYIIEQRKNKIEVQRNTLKIKEPKITNKDIIQKIAFYLTPFIIIELIKTLYNSIDAVVLVKVLVNDLGMTITNAEGVLSIILFWGYKLNMIVIAIISAIITKEIINLSTSYVQNDMILVKRKINKIYQKTLFFVIPITMIVGFLAQPIWTLFYGTTAEYGPNVYQYYAYISIGIVMFSTTTTIARLLKENKMIIISSILGIILKIILNVPIMHGFKKMGFPGYYGSITTTILGLLLSSVICIILLNKKYKITYETTLKEFFNILLAVVIMMIVLSGIKLLIPFSSTSRIISILYILLYFGIATGVYLTITYSTKTINTVFKRK